MFITCRYIGFTIQKSSTFLYTTTVGILVVLCIALLIWFSGQLVHQPWQRIISGLFSWIWIYILSCLSVISLYWYLLLGYQSVSWIHWYILLGYHFGGFTSHTVYELLELYCQLRHIVNMLDIDLYFTQTCRRK